MIRLLAGWVGHANFVRLDDQMPLLFRFRVHTGGEGQQGFYLLRKNNGSLDFELSKTVRALFRCQIFFTLAGENPKIAFIDGRQIG